MSKPWQPCALHILDLTEDEVLYDAALRNLQTLSEATQLLPDEKKAAFSAIPWREISGFRNILVHNYLGNIDPLTVVNVIETYLQPLEDCIRSMLAGADGSG
jgi:uncharacterized protein with HEPN domain